MEKALGASSGLRERRWIVLGEDGRHVTIGRHTDPNEDELAQAATALSATGQGGWVAVTEGRYYSRDRITLMMVRELTPTRVSWETAVAAFEAARRVCTGNGTNTGNQAPHR